MNDILEYPGKELELFDKAILWRKYLYFKTKTYFGKEVLEVGAGIGSFTEIYKSEEMNITLTELDPTNLRILKKKFQNVKGVSVEGNFTKSYEKKFDTIIYMSVLEHIEDDTKEIDTALSKLKEDGNLIICVPAHNYMYSQFDKEIGHFRRYNINYFKDLRHANAKLIKCYMIDTMGWLMYFLNKIFFKKEKYPSPTKIFIWDKLFIPFTIAIDYLTFYKFGKNIISVIKKNH